MPAPTSTVPTRTLTLRPFRHWPDRIAVTVWPSLQAMRRHFRSRTLLGLTLPGPDRPTLATIHLPKTGSMATLVHELAHAAFLCLDARPSPNHEERFCQVIERLLTQARQRGLPHGGGCSAAGGAKTGSPTGNARSSNTTWKPARRSKPSGAQATRRRAST